MKNDQGGRLVPVGPPTHAVRRPAAAVTGAALADDPNWTGLRALQPVPPDPRVTPVGEGRAFGPVGDALTPHAAKLARILAASPAIAAAVAELIEALAVPGLDGTAGLEEWQVPGGPGEDVPGGDLGLDLRTMFGNRAGQRDRSGSTAFGFGDVGLASDDGGHRDGSDRDDDATRRDREMRRGDGPRREDADSSDDNPQSADSGHRTAGFVLGTQQQDANAPSGDADSGTPDAAPDGGPGAPDGGPDAGVATGDDGGVDAGSSIRYPDEPVTGTHYDSAGGVVREFRGGDTVPGGWTETDYGHGLVMVHGYPGPGTNPNPNPDAPPSLAELQGLYQLLGYFHPSMFWGPNRSTNPRRVRPGREADPNAWGMRLVVEGLNDAPPRLRPRGPAVRPQVLRRSMWGGHGPRPIDPTRALNLLAEALKGPA